MSKRHITYTCGHEDTIQLYGSYSDRERRAEYVARQHCPACAAKARAATATTANYPLATEIRTRILAEAAQAVEQQVRPGLLDPSKAAHHPAMRAVLVAYDKLRAETSDAVWIGYRDTDGYSLLKQMTWAALAAVKVTR